MSELRRAYADLAIQAGCDDLSAALDAAANLAAYAESVARFGHGTRDTMHNLVQAFEERAGRARTIIKRLESRK